jgi:PAS domain S-box-containing protein
MGALSEPRSVVREPGDLLDEHLLDLPDRLLDLLPVGVYVCDRDGLIVRWNRCAAELWGRTPELGDPDERFCGSLRLYRVDGGPLAYAECPMADVLRTGVGARDQEVVIERPDGSRVVALVNIEALKDAAGSVVGAVNCFRDVTERWRLDAAVRENQLRLQELLEALPTAIYTTDAAGRITSYNQAAVDLWGHRPKLGQDAWCGSWRLYWPDGTPMPHDECPMAVALKEGRVVRGAEAVAERPDGTRVHFVPYPTPLFDESGAPIGAVNTLIDITEHRHAKEVGARLAAIVESSDDAIVSKDLNGIIRSWNRGAERLFGYAAEEVVGQPITILIPPDRQDEETDILERIRRGERIDHYETVRRRKDGSPVEISLTVSPVRDAAGRVTGASKIARDITERRRSEEKQKLLLREMSHRARNLFALASSVVTLSARSAETPQDMAQAVRERLGALARAHDLTLPDLAGGDKVDKATTLPALLRAIVSPYDGAEDQDDRRVHLSGPDVPIQGSAVTSLALLLHEFAANSAKYGALSAPTGRLEARWSVAEDELLLEWKEQGGPPLAGPSADEGFGSLLARQAVEGQLGGRIFRDWHDRGLIIRLSLPVASLAR